MLSVARRARRTTIPFGHVPVDASHHRERSSRRTILASPGTRSAEESDSQPTRSRVRRAWDATSGTSTTGSALKCALETDGLAHSPPTSLRPCHRRRRHSHPRPLRRPRRRHRRRGRRHRLPPPRRRCRHAPPAGPSQPDSRSCIRPRLAPANPSTKRRSAQRCQISSKCRNRTFVSLSEAVPPLAVGRCRAAFSAAAAAAAIPSMGSPMWTPRLSSSRTPTQPQRPSSVLLRTPITSH